MFSRSENPFLILLLSFCARVSPKIQVNFRYRRYWWFCLMNFEISSVFMFSRSRNPLLAFLLSYRVWVTLKIQVNIRYRRYWWFCLMNFWNFFSIYVFRCQGIHCWHSYWATVFGWPWKSRSTSGTGGTDDSVLWIFEISSVFMFSRSRNPLLTFLLSYLVWVTSETSRTGSWPRFSRSPKRGSSVGISAMDSLTLET